MRGPGPSVQYKTHRGLSSSQRRGGKPGLHRSLLNIRTGFLGSLAKAGSHLAGPAYRAPSSAASPSNSAGISGGPSMSSLSEGPSMNSL